MPAPDTRRVPAEEPWAAGSAYSMYVQGIDLNETAQVSNRATKTKWLVALVYVRELKKTQLALV